MEKLKKCVKCGMLCFTIKDHISICQSCIKQPVNDMHPIFADIHKSFGMME